MAYQKGKPMLNPYQTIRQIIANNGGSNSNDDDVKDAMLEHVMNDRHLTDDQLDEALESYRMFELHFPGYCANA